MPVTQEHIKKAVELAKEYGAVKLLLFGSALTNPQNAADLDLGVYGIEGMKLFEFAGKLEYIINLKVDIVDLGLENNFVNHINKVGKYIYDSTSTFN